MYNKQEGIFKRGQIVRWSGASNQFGWSTPLIKIKDGMLREILSVEYFPTDDRYRMLLSDLDGEYHWIGSKTFTIVNHASLTNKYKTMVEVAEFFGKPCAKDASGVVCMHDEIPQIEGLGWRGKGGYTVITDFVRPVNTFWTDSLYVPSKLCTKKKYKAYSEPKIEWVKEKKKILYYGKIVSISSICVDNEVRLTQEGYRESDERYTMQELLAEATELDSTPFGEEILNE